MAAHRRLEPLAIGAGREALRALPAIERALDGRGPALQPYAAGSPAPTRGPAPTPDERLPEGLALCVGTSGSTGSPKHSMLTGEAIRASARATEDVLGGPGRWLLALPAHHIAGLQVLVRATLAGHAPTVLDLSDGFTPEGFVETTRVLTGLTSGPGRRYASLVPTQLTRILDDHEASAALAAYDAVLVGGAATPPILLALAADAGARIVTTYGSSETAGGCVYNGFALPGVQVHIDNDDHVVLGGSTLAHGYLDQPGLTADSFSTDADGVRWFRTDDLGHRDDAGRLQLHGRADDLVNTGGLKVAPGPVEDAVLRFVEGVRDAVVVGVPHPTWSQAVTVAITTYGGPAPTLRELRAALRGVVPDHALPQQVLVLDRIPMRGPGKPDRAALAAAMAADS